jgi:hypothetical protein
LLSIDAFFDPINFAVMIDHMIQQKQVLYIQQLLVNVKIIILLVVYLYSMKIDVLEKLFLL